MNKIQLFTNGDSNTFGSELLTNNSWPVMLSKKLNCTVDNYAFPGSSNDKIIRETTDYVVNNLNNADNLIVVLGFTEMSRIELFSDELNSWIQIAHAHINSEDKIKYSKLYYKTLHSFVYDSVMFWQKTLLLQSFLEYYKVKYLFFSCFKDSLIERFYLYNKNIPSHLETKDFDSNRAIKKYKSYIKGLSSRIEYLNKNILNQINEDKFIGLKNAYTMYSLDINKDIPKGQFGHLLEEGHENWAIHLYNKYKNIYE